MGVLSFFPALYSLNSIFTLSFPGAIGQLLDSLEEIQVLTGAKTDDVNFLQSLFENHTLQALLEVMILSVLRAAESNEPITTRQSYTCRLHYLRTVEPISRTSPFLCSRIILRSYLSMKYVGISLLFNRFDWKSFLISATS